MPAKYATYKTRQIMEKSVHQSEKILNNPYLMAGIESPDKLRRNLAREKEQLEKLTPPPIETDSERAALTQREAILREALLKGSSRQGMPAALTHQEMWKVPRGATDRLTTWEDRAKNFTIDGNGNLVRALNGYGIIFEMRDIRRRLYSEMEPQQTNVASFEPFRPVNNNVSLAETNQPMQFPPARLTYQEFVFQHPDFWPNHAAVKAGLYADEDGHKFFAFGENSAIVRTQFHPLGAALKRPDGAVVTLKDVESQIEQLERSTPAVKKSGVSAEERKRRSDRFKKMHADRKAAKSGVAAHA